MTSNELVYVKETKIWVSHPEKVWECAILQENYIKGCKSLKISKGSGELSEIFLNREDDLPPLRNPAILIGQNDLTALSYLHEPAVLHNLEIRFRERQAIYTYCGIVLVAINPYAELPLYGSDIIRAYRGHSMGELEPHIFAVAEEAYAKLEREKCDQSVIVSGESGAGKTVSAKYVMRYFAAVGGSESETQIERRVLASSPIMEAIGNAKTIRNDNSSRFGKFTKLLFRNDLGTMILTGATMQTYLLEKSRVVFQAHSERNYHIFYQLCAGREKWPELILDDQSKFRYLNSGKSLKINNVCDLNQLNETLGALRTLGFTSQDVNEIMKVLAGILHLGNIEVTYKHKKNSNENDPDGSDISLNDLHLNIVSEVLRINVEDLRKWLILRQIESVNEFVLIPQSPAASMTARDALSKHIYSKLFQYIVSVINLSLMCGKSQNCFIGVLDIYGFETFDTNSFEQFCINYANEKLQQQFNQHVFKLEQEEYLKEGIVWTMIDFYDNQPCIDLIESKLGILDLLDEECKVPKGTDESWASKIIDKCIKYKHFERPRFGSTSFFIKHFSDIVQYDVQGFLEKNRDTVSKELVNVIRQSEITLCRKLMELEETDIIHDGLVAPARGRVVVSAAKTQIATSRQHKKTIGSQFRDSLSLLITTLHSTTPHYVRCIKPNEEKVAFKWEPSKIVQQLRACGVLETVRISAAGFPSRWLYSDFYNRYRLLCSKDQIIENDIKQTCKHIVLKWSADDDKYRFGYTQIFFRAGQVAYLEQIRSNIRKKYIIIVQSIIRRFVYRSFYLHLQRSALGIQTYARGFLARRKAENIRQNRAAITIQRYIRGWFYKIRYLKLKSAILGIQKYARGLLSRQLFNDLLKNYKATQIQRICRGYLARRAYKKKLESVIKSQAVIRAFLARRLYKRLKAEARTIVHIQKMYKGLENKIISLQQKIDEITKENHILKIKVGDIPKLKLQIEAKKSLENELKNIKQEILEKDLTIEKITKQLEVVRDENMMMLDEKGRDHEEWKKQKRTWRMQNEELRKQFDEMIEMAKKKDSSKIEQRTKLLSEVDSNEIYQAYQRALKDKEIIENENYLLKEELNRLRKVDEGTNEFNILSPLSQNELTEPSVNKQTILILKLRKILEEEKLKNDTLSKQLDIIKFRSSSTLAEDSIRASELEVENDKLRYDYQLLRNSIMRGVEHKELQAQHLALQEELGRRREECIQLRAVLAEQSQSLKQLGFGNNTGQDFNTWQENGALAEAFQAQKLVNRQLESELEALTKEHNTRLADLTTQLENERVERNQLQSMLQNKLEDSDEKDCDTLRRNEKYLRYELEKSLVDYATSQEQINELNKKIAQLLKTSTNLASKLREHGVFDIHLNDDNSTSMISVKKKTSQKFQGIFKYQYEEVDKILQHLITDFTPRIAISLLPGLPAFVIFMCIRYTDLVNTEQHVKELLTKFVLLMKKIYRLPHTIEYRVLWLVNTLTLHNLLKQYGGFEEFISVNTFMQNQQQLKNFDLSEYRQVIYDNIMNLYQELIKQIQSLIKPQIVPAIIDHDETAQGKASVTGRSMSLDLSPDHKLGHKPKSLISHFEQFYKQFQYFGLGDCYIEQIFKQLVYFICAVSMNSLMLRGKICMWKIGMQMRYNISCLEDWMKKKKMSEEIISPIIPLNQVSLLLQSRKTEEDVQSIYELCTNLTTAQVLKLIKSHNVDDFENEISNTFIEKLTKKLNQRHPVLVSDSFTMNEDFIYPLKVVFTYSDIKLEDIELPAALNLDGLLSKI